MEIKKVVVVSDNPDINTFQMRTFVRQRPGLKDGKYKHFAYDSLQTELTCRDLTAALNSEGYLHPDVHSFVYVRPKTKNDRNPKCEVTYFLNPNQEYTIRNINFNIEDQAVDSLLHTNDILSHNLTKGARFRIADLNAERSEVTKFLQDNGYYKFNKDFIYFDADTISGETTVDITMTLRPYRANSNAEEEPHPCYKIRNISYRPGGGETALVLRKSVLDENTALQENKPYSAAGLATTYQRFARLQALRYTNILFNEVTDSANAQSTTPKSNLLDCDIVMSSRKPNSISFQPEGTNTAGDLGAAVSLTYENRNLFRGSETFSIQLRGAYENISGLEGYNNEDYIEYGAEAKLQFPRLLAPFISRSFKRSKLSTSELSVAYNNQNRPEFHRRVFSAALRYKWAEPKHNMQYKIDLLDLNYIHMPWISETFKHDYLDSVSNRNAILRYNYEDLFIMKIGFGMSFNNGVNAWKFNIETSGNLLNGLSHLCSFPKNDQDQYTLFNIAYAQYVKGDIDATHLLKLTERSEVAFHGGLGIAYPYGNSTVLPFEKRYFSGGANSVRGWSVRELGPGSYKGSDGRIDFINQTGDVKLDLNIEYRTFLFWKVYGAIFADAGNIWTIREYESQPGGQFRFDTFYKQLAAAYGAGIRFNFGYFIVRFDCGMKAVNPAYETSREHYPILHPDLSRDFTFHFAVGLPF